MNTDIESPFQKYNLDEQWQNYSLGGYIEEYGEFIVDGDWVESADMDETGEVKMIQLGNLKDSAISGPFNKRVTKSWCDENNVTLLQEGDIITARMPDPIFRSVVVPKEHAGTSIVPVDIMIIRGLDEVRAEFLSQYLNSYFAEIQGESYASGSTRDRISRKNAEEIGVPVPPLEEQREIVSLLSDVDEYIEKTSERVHALEQQKQAILQRVFEDHKTVKENSTLGDYGLKFVKGKTPSEDGGNIPYLSTGVYRDNDKPEDYTIEEEATVVTKDDIAMIMDGSNSGEVFSGKEGAISSTMAKLSFEDDIEKAYVKSLLEWFYPHINANAMGSTIPHTSKKVVERLPVFHTRESDQIEISRVISDINKEISIAKQDRDSMRELKQGVLQNLFSV